MDPNETIPHKDVKGEKKDQEISETAIKKPIKKLTADDDRYVQNKIKRILNSQKVNKAEIDQYIGWHVSDEERIRFIIKALELQYTKKISEIINQRDKDELTDFLNRYIHSLAEYQKAGYPKSDVVSPEELVEFRQLAADTDKIPMEMLAESAPVLTISSYLKMCRIVYDATSLWKYPNDITTEHIYGKERMIEGVSRVYTDWDSPEEFARFLCTQYHSEELWFGGPALNIENESKWSNQEYTYPKIFRKWIGRVGDRYFDSVKLYRCVKMYLALRKNGYPIYIRQYDEIYNEVIKLNYLRK